MLKGKVNLKQYSLVKEFKTVRSSLKRVVITIGIIICLYIIWRLYENNRIVNDYLYEPFIPPQFQLLIVFGLIGFAVLILLAVRSEQVLLFREGIYVNLGFFERIMLRGVESHAGFIPWDKLRIIIRSPYLFIGMSLVGEGPLDELILPEGQRKHFDEIQDMIYELKTTGLVKMIDLVNPTQEPLTVVRSAITTIALLLSFISCNVMNVVMPLTNYSMFYRQNKSIPYLSMVILLIMIPAVVKMYRMGQFSCRFEIYEEGIFTLMEGKGAFTRWDEIKSIQRVKDGVYSIKHLITKAKPMKMKIDVDKIPEFEHLINSAGILIEGE